MTRHLLVAAAGLCPLVAGAAHGQVDLYRFQRQLEQIQRETRLLVDHDVPADQRALLDYGGFVAVNFLAIDDVNQNTHILRQTDLNGYLRVNLDGAHEFFLRARTSYRDFNTGDAFRSSGDDWVEPTLDRAHYRFDLQRYLAAYEGRVIPGNVIVQGGRQLVHWANGLTLSHEIDGAVVQLSRRRLTLDILAGITRDSATDLDSSRPGFTNETNRNFLGGMLSFRPNARHRPYVYGIVQRDNNPSEVLVAGRTTTKFEYNSYYLGFGSNGSLGDHVVYGAEFVFEGGDGLSNSINGAGAAIPQTTEDIEAFAMDVRLDYLVTDRNRTRLSAEFLLASGDTDRDTATNTIGGNASGTKDHGFNAFGLINTGLAFNPAVSNLIMVRAGASTFPLKGSHWFDRLQLGVNLFMFNKFNRNGGIDEATTDGTILGWESDLFANWQATSDVTVSLRYGVFIPGDAIAGEQDERHFFFSGLTFAF